MTAAAPPRTPAELVAASPFALAKLVSIDGPFGPIPLDLWPMQEVALLNALHHRRNIDLKARQLGITEAVAVLLPLWESISYPVGTDLVISLTEDDADDVIDRIKRMYWSAPEWLHHAWPVAVDRSDEFRLQHPRGTSGVLALSSSSNAGRSRTFRRVIGDEAARWDNADERIASLLPASADIGSMMLISTAKGLNRFWETWNAAPGNGWHPLFVPADARPDRSLEWISTMRAALGPLGAQEYPLTPHEAFLATTASDFDTDALQRFLDEWCRPAPWRGELREREDGTVCAVRRDAGPWQVWEAPQPGRTYVLGGDFSGGGASADATSIPVFDASSWEQVATYWGRPNPDQAAREMARAGRLWRSPDGPSLLIPEANNHGQAVVAHLVEQGYPRIYEPEKFDIERGGTRAGKSHGWLMNGRSKPVAIAALQAGVREGTLGIRDAALIGEMLRFSGGEASVGNDDRVLAASLVAAVLTHSFAGLPRTERRPDKPYWKPKDRVAGY